MVRYDKAIEAQWRLALPHMFISRNSATRLQINVLPFAGYKLPPYTDTEFGETITAGGAGARIPANLLQGTVNHCNRHC